MTEVIPFTASEPEQPEKPHLQYFSANEVGTEDEVLEDEFVERVLMKEKMSALYGDSNSGKTFTAIDIACSVALGRPWMGRRTERGAVIYLAAEAPESIRLRIKAYKKHYGITEDLPIYVVTTPINFYSNEADARDVVDLVQYIERTECIKVVLTIGDTFARLAAGADENGGRDMSVVLKHADLIKTTCMTHFMWIHHSGKDAAKGMRGWSGFRGHIDTEIEVAEFDANPVRLITVTKQRDGEGKGDTYGFTLNPVPIGTNRWGEVRTSCVVVPDIAPVKREKGSRVSKLDVAIERAWAGALAVDPNPNKDLLRKHFYCHYRLEPSNFDEDGNINSKGKETRERAFSRAWRTHFEALISAANDAENDSAKGEKVA